MNYQEEEIYSQYPMETRSVLVYSCLSVSWNHIVYRYSNQLRKCWW